MPNKKRLVATPRHFQSDCKVGGSKVVVAEEGEEWLGSEKSVSGEEGREGTRRRSRTEGRGTDAQKQALHTHHPFPEKKVQENENVTFASDDDEKQLDCNFDL